MRVYDNSLINNYKLDDKIYVILRNWDDLVSEFGTDLDGDIKTESFYSELIEKEIPKSRCVQIKVISDEDYSVHANSLHFSFNNCWQIDGEIIEKILIKENEPEYFV